MILLVLAAVTSFVNGPAAQPTPAPAAAPLGIASADDNKVICHTMENTGSLFSDRICHTKGEWNEIAANAKKLQTDIQNSNGISGSMNAVGGAKGH